MNNIIKAEGRNLKNILNRFRKKDFSGDGGQAIKNSSYQLAQNIIFKLGSLLFTIIIARLLLPDRMGLYSLALSTIVLFASFSDLGIGPAITTFIGRMLGENNPRKAKGYLIRLIKWKSYLLLFSSSILVCAGYFLVKYYYQKPIFYAILVGALYIPIIGITGMIEGLFKADNNFKTPLFKEIFLQITRLILGPLSIILFLKMDISDELMIPLVLLTITFCYIISGAYLYFVAKKKISFLDSKESSLNPKEAIDLKKFIYPLVAMATAGMFFGYIDTLMLGHFVSGEFISYYSVAFSLINGAATIIGFLAGAIMPIFARNRGEALESIFKKTRNLTIFISAVASFTIYFLARYVVLYSYGLEYIESYRVLKLFSILIFLTPLSGLYDAYFTTQKKTNQLATLIGSSAVLNVVLNWILIAYGINYLGEMGAVFGACIATILSRGLYLFGLMILRKR